MSEKKATVAVQIVTYNSAKDIGSCLQSVLSQSLTVDEVIVVDNASSDETVANLSTADTVRCIRNDRNAGFAAAHNQALAQSASDYVVALNPDVTLHPDYLLYAIDFLVRNPQVGSVTGLLLRKQDGRTIDSTGLCIDRKRKAVDRCTGAIYDGDKNPVEVFGVSGAAAVYRRKMVDEVSFQGQFFDEAFFAYKEDVDTAWRAQLLGWTSYFVPMAIAYHERGWKEGSRFEKPLFLRRHSYINRYRMMMKNESVYYVIKHSPWILLYEAASLGYLLLRDPKLAGAWVDLWRDRHRLLQQRKWIQERRKASWREVYGKFQ
ncbi:glycosyltransferase family 2 protein [Paenibacillus sp.]|uniref:glycosyltransferase family 2 protein n=1 Tax=Paenibacillus sp. TaxID=58172 RepID=UPI002810C33D|nr:glycosyltransferase family 2 protein [Paenibacillus sp.]